MSTSVAGGDVSAAAASLAAVPGVVKVLSASSPHLAGGIAENMSPLIISAASGATHIVGSASAYAKNILPRVAALMDVNQISDVTAIESEDTFQRPIYAGNAIATVQSTDAVKVSF